MNALLESSAIFRDRHHAGALLASRLRILVSRDTTIVLGLPRGGVPVASAIAENLGLPLDVLVVRKLGVPDDEEIAFGAVASGGVEVHNDDVIAAFALSPYEMGRIAARARAELDQRDRLLRWARPSLCLRGENVLIVDDGIATGATMRAAVQAARWRGAERVTVAAPVAARETREFLQHEVDDVVTVVDVDHLLAVREFYRDFAPTTDDEVLDILRAQPFGVGHIEEEPA
jgi:putative phosphoribosyl transferase